MLNILFSDKIHLPVMDFILWVCTQAKMSRLPFTATTADTITLVVYTF